MDGHGGRLLASQQQTPSAQLFAMFPDFDRSVIMAVLDSERSVEAAIEVLLGVAPTTHMAPSPHGRYSPDAAAVAAELDASGSRQLEEDEALARALQEQMILDAEREEHRDERAPARQHLDYHYPGTAALNQRRQAGTVHETSFEHPHDRRRDLLRADRYADTSDPSPEREGVLAGVGGAVYSAGSGLVDAAASATLGLWGWVTGDSAEERAAMRSQRDQAPRSSADREGMSPIRERCPPLHQLSTTRASTPQYPETAPCSSASRLRAIHFPSPIS
jgi:hypothetical protein